MATLRLHSARSRRQAHDRHARRRQPRRRDGRSRQSRTFAGLDRRARKGATAGTDGSSTFSISLSRQSELHARAAVGGRIVHARAGEPARRRVCRCRAALHLLRREASNPGAKNVWGKIHDDVVGGDVARRRDGEVAEGFSTVYVAMVRAGEAGGFLPIVLQQIADFRTREQDLKGKVKAAMVYPFVLACSLSRCSSSC